jgi:hypothetical protein
MRTAAGHSGASDRQNDLVNRLRRLVLRPVLLGAVAAVYIVFRWWRGADEPTADPEAG